MKNFIKTALLLSILILNSLLCAQTKLNMFVQELHFKEASGSTLMHIDYQIPYRNLVFLAQKGGYFAHIDIRVSIPKGDSLIVIKELTDNVGLSNKEDATSDKSHINRISFLLDEEIPRLYFKAVDANSKLSFFHQINAKILTNEDVLSDVQLCSIVQPDSVSQSKFRRGNMLYKSEASLIFDKSKIEKIHLYVEAYPSAEWLNSSALLNLYVQKDSLIVEDEIYDFQLNSAIQAIHMQIPTHDLKTGNYQASLSIQMGDIYAEKEFEFFITETKEPIYSLLDDPEEELLLLRYFSSGSSPMDWNRYDLATKKNYLSGLWKRLASNSALSPNAILNIVQERLDYANANFKYFKEGWKTDMGRIHIRNGKADEIEKDSIQEVTRYVSKDYQIWKYRGKVNAVYVFVDVQMNGNYQLIYVRGDEMESTRADYQRYLGEDFDTSKLNN